MLTAFLALLTFSLLTSCWENASRYFPRAGVKPPVRTPSAPRPHLAEAATRFCHCPEAKSSESPQAGWPGHGNRLPTRGFNAVKTRRCEAIERRERPRRPPCLRGP